MNIEPFVLERYFARHEFSARHLLSCSDCEPLGLAELLEMAGSEHRRLWDELRLAYTESAGHPRLRQAIAGLDHGLEPEDVLVVVPEEGIFLLMHALLAPGDHVICTLPAYQSLHAVARSIGAEISFWLPDEDDGWRFAPERLEELLRPDTRLVVVNFPHNPTGACPQRSDFERIVEIVERSGALLLSDEMYRFLELAPGATLPAACTLSRRALSLGGLSKSFGLPGLRLGWMASRDRDLLGKMATLKDYTTICAAAPSEILAIIALANRETIVDRHLGRVRRNVAAVGAFVEERRDLLAWHPPRGGSVCFPRWLGPGGAQQLAGDAVTHAGIMIAPSTLFGYGDRHLRIGCGREDLPEVLGRFGEYLTHR
jgi:aspartate/methionine/tyrosine aminotransferase